MSNSLRPPVSPQPPPPPAEGGMPFPPPVKKRNETPWPMIIVLGCLVVGVILVFWQMGTRNPQGLPSKNQFVAQQKESAKKFTVRADAEYVLFKGTLLMPDLNDTDDRMTPDKKYLKDGSRIHTRSSQEKDGKLWYNVDATDAEGKPVGPGWISEKVLLDHAAEVKSGQ